LADSPHEHERVQDAPRVALVTGGASGIGRATVLRLVGDGFVVGAMDRDTAALDRLVTECREAGVGGSLLGVPADVTHEVAVAEGIDALRARYDRPVTVLVNNAGIAGGGGFLDADDGAFRRLLSVHLEGALHATRAVLPGMLAGGSGVIVNVLTDGLWHGGTSVTYTTAKGALLGFTRSLAREVAPSGVRVNAVAPGPVATAMLLDDAPGAIAAELASVPIGRALTPDEVAATIAFLCGPGGQAYVGAVLSPNGGTVFPG
jgi:3-oxoacyl-[acyl-carrier protein] reductase